MVSDVGFFFFPTLRVEFRSPLPLNYISSPLYYYFLRQGLTRLPRLALNL